MREASLSMATRSWPAPLFVCLHLTLRDALHYTAIEMEKDTTTRPERVPTKTKKIERASQLRQDTAKKPARPVPEKMTPTDQRRQEKPEELLLQSFKDLYSHWKEVGLLRKPR